MGKGTKSLVWRPLGEEWRSCLLGLKRIFENFLAGLKGSFIMRGKSFAFEVAQLDCCPRKRGKKEFDIRFG